MSHSTAATAAVVNGDNSHVSKAAQSALAYTPSNTMLPITNTPSTATPLTGHTTVQTPAAASSSASSSSVSSSAVPSEQAVPAFRPSRSNLSLNFGQVGGESAKKRIKIENYLQETPELAKVFNDTPGSTVIPFNGYSPLQTPDLAKIVISTPELDRIALNFSGRVPGVPLATPMTLANILGDPVMNSLANASATGNNASQNHVTVINAPLNPITMGQGALEDSDDIKGGRKRYRSSTIDEQTRQHANSLLMLSSHSEHSVSSTDSHPTDQILPIDMDNQERIKIDRKRERNRIAASRCRQRKLERISTLQDKVREFEEKNDKLTRYIEFLEELVQRRENAFCTHQRFNCQQ